MTFVIKSLKVLMTVVVPAAVMFVFASCHHVDDDRIPVMPVSLTFNTVAEWNIYGVSGALEYRRFIKEERIPASFPFTAISQTGFGGVLLVDDVNGNPMAYDLSCPVECRRDVRVVINTDRMDAECPVCHSTYDVFSLYGHPLSGQAAVDGFGLKRYRVGPGRMGEYMVVSN